MASVGFDGGVLKQLPMLVRADSHVLLAQSMDMGIDVVGVLIIGGQSHQPRHMLWLPYQLLVQWDLVELDRVNLSRGTAQQRRGR